jgi:predicted Zn-dependent protease
VFLFVAGALLQDRGHAAGRAPKSGPQPLPTAARVALPITALAVIAVIAVPWRSNLDITQSQTDFRAGDYKSALEKAKSAVSLEPYSAVPRLQVALVHERLGELGPAARAAREAVDRESTNWENWYVLSRIQAQRPGMRQAALRALRQARRYDPASSFLNP